MSGEDFSSWVNRYARRHSLWFSKRLSANDTQATGGHQAGFHIPKRIIFTAFPAGDSPDEENPDAWFDLHIDSHGYSKSVRATWYDNRLRGGTRNETRVTSLGGKESALLDQDNTGALVVFAFMLESDKDAGQCHAWICRSAMEEDLAENHLVGPIEPGKYALWSPHYEEIPSQFPAPQQSVEEHLQTQLELPPEWLKNFPSTSELAGRMVQVVSFADVPDPDRRLKQRCDGEYELFLSVEEATELPVIRTGFPGVDEFVERANSVLQRRKARAGRSLELHVREILEEEGLESGTDFEHGVESEPGRRPDFLFPSRERYLDMDFPADRLRMLAVKRTCRDRWRQILNEADRIPLKHLLTLQDGVSGNQFQEMVESGVQLVAPEPLIKCYPKEIRNRLMTFGDFIREVKALRESA